MDKAEEIAIEYSKSFDRYYEPEQIKELAQAIRQHAQQVSREWREKLMWVYANSIGSDSIIGLHVCDNYLEWEKRLNIDIKKWQSN